MFAPPVAKTQTKTATSWTNKLAHQRPTLVAQRLGHGLVRQAQLLQRSTGNQSTLRLLAQRGSTLTGGKPGGDHEREANPTSLSARTATHRISRDFSKCPMFPPDRPEAQSPFTPTTFQGTIQAKLVVGHANDPLEHEADHVADQVMRMPAPEHSIAAAPSRLSRKCAACEEEAQTPQSQLAGSPEAAGEAPGIVNEMLSSSEQSLDAGIRTFMEPRFGFDFSSIRIHTDPLAGDLADGLNAHAFTIGNHIAFARGRYQPQSPEGGHLLAHELAHVVQQGGGSRDIGPAAPQIQRLVRTASVTCPAAATGIANPHTGSADRSASGLLDHAITRIANAQALRVASPADPDVVDVGNALHTVFHLDPADAATWTALVPDVRLPVILRRLQAAKAYIDSVVFTVTCIPNGGAGYTIPGCANTTCGPGTEAFSCHANPVEIVLCPDFWALGVAQRGRTWMHEVMHITFQFIDDWGQPNVHNAHCYAQFVALLNGFNSPAGFRCP
jgi:hypothetical protein